MKKQTRDAVILSVALVALLVVAIVTIRGMQGDQVPAPVPATTNVAAPPTPTAPATANKPAAPAEAGTLPWIDDTRLSNIVTEVKGGRNPFIDLTLPKSPESNTPVPSTTKVTPPEVTTPAEPNPIEPDMNPPLNLVKTLNWTTPEVLAARFAQAKLNVNLTPTGRPDQVKLEGYSPDFERAVEIINALDVAPPIPKFVLSGVIATPTQRLAVVLLDGKQYSLLEGESIPELGWIVTKITPTGVNLTKGKLSTKLRLSGGSPS